MQEKGGEIIGAITRELAEKGVGFMELADMRVNAARHTPETLRTSEWFRLL